MGKRLAGAAGNPARALLERNIAGFLRDRTLHYYRAALGTIA